MRGPDLDRERCERKLSLAQFLVSYNEGLPSEFPRATQSLLKEFNTSHPDLFKTGNVWSLDQHRKRVMDWLPSRVQVRVEA